MTRPIAFLLACALCIVGFAQEYDQELIQSLVRQANKQGNPGRGAVLFAAPTTACISCHKVGEHGGEIGPDLSSIATKQKPEQIVESLLWPNQIVADHYKAIAIVTGDGNVIRGYLIRETDDEFVVRDMTDGKERVLDQDDVEDIKEVGSLMPDGLLNSLSDQFKYDLVAFVTDLGKGERIKPSAVDALLSHSHSHHPADFDMPRAPIDPEIWPNWQAHINRDRIYDFYAKQARHYRDVSPRPPLLKEYGSLDSTKYGHWGNQSDLTWAGNEWNETDKGSLLSGVFHGGKLHIARGKCVKIGEGSSAISAVFDPDRLEFRRVWSGGFIKVTDTRHGFMSGLLQDGNEVKNPDIGKSPYRQDAKSKYLGLYRHGKQVLFSYSIDGVDYIDTLKRVDGELKRIVAPRMDHPDRDSLSGGPAQWPQVFKTKGTLGKPGNGSPYAIDNIELPWDNPWKAQLFLGDHDFLSDGSVVACTMQGDIWRADGLAGDLENVRWRRIASGLHQTLGLVVHDNQIYVLGRDQITRLHDLNDDGEMDFYECFSDAVETSRGGHDFTCGLARDDQGRFYTATGLQGVVRVSADGKSATVLGNGLRNSDGIGLTPDGLVTVPSSEGDWTPASMIAAIRPDGPVLNRLPVESPDSRGLPFFGRPGHNLKHPPDLPMLYMPRGMDNSSGGQAFVSGDRWGPLQGQLVHFSYGAGSAYILLRDEFDGWIQGAAVPFVGEFASGSHRGKFSPVDGQLYVSGMGGWGHYTVSDGCLARVRYTGERLPMPIGFHVHENGVRVDFSESLDQSVLENANGHFAQAWNYRFSGGYGSPEFSTRQFGLRGHDVFDIRSATLSENGKSVFVEIPDLQPVNQLHLLVKISPQKSHDLFMTVHKLDKPFTDIPNYKPEEKVTLPHPIETDFTRPRSVKRNPFRKLIPNPRVIEISAAKNLMFDKTELRAKSGEVLRLKFINPDAVPHNWALLKSGTLQKVGTLANQLISDPEAAGRQYIPNSKDVLAYTDVVEPNGSFTIHFKAPSKPGRYPYLCTFPGHWMVMNGTMIVE